MRLALTSTGQANPPPKACPACYEELSSSVSQGFRLRIEQEQREKNRLMMWKGRVQLVKTARENMMQKAYSEAAVNYEKYLRVLEISHNLQRGNLTPAVFSNSSRSKELSVVASAYWDLVRIYDTNPRYGDRMQKSAEKLSEFLPYSNMYSDILRKAEIFARSARNAEVMNKFLKDTKAQRGPCFIADAAFADFGEALAPTTLRQFRDQCLLPSVPGRRLVLLYYRVSPPLARVIRRHPRLAAVTRFVLSKIADQMQKHLNSN